VRASDSLARVGGDEFAVLLAGTGHADARAAVSALCHAVAEAPCPVEGADLAVRTSAGYVILDREVDDADGAFAAADAALYRAKAAGGGRAVGAHDPAAGVD
jgi:diguanylate cyclase (GGDEF)-like protein